MIVSILIEPAINTILSIGNNTAKFKINISELSSNDAKPNEIPGIVWTILNMICLTFLLICFEFISSDSHKNAIYLIWFNLIGCSIV